VNFIPLAKPLIEDKEIAEVVKTIKSGWLTTGPKVFEFEEELSNYLQEDDKLFSVALNSCTNALFLSLLALGITKDDEVIVPTLTFAATAQVVEWIGATLKLCDIDKNTLNIDTKHLKTLITPKTKAIIVVHIAGYPCEMDEILNIAKEHHLKVIEDSAHAIGTKYNNKKIGNFSDITCFSFYATKNLAMGEGGAAVSKDKDLIQKIRKLSYFGIDKEAFKRYDKKGTWFYDITSLGYKCNLDSLHATLGLSQLKKLDSMNQRRREIALLYRKNLKNVGFFEDNQNHYHSYHLFEIILPKNVNRDEFILQMKEKNIGCSVHFIPLHLHSFYKNRFEYNSFVNANEIYPQIVSIPMYPGLSDEEVWYVIEKINEVTQ
jgi:perosamine synthetase